jgi:hypothetical protein
MINFTSFLYVTGFQVFDNGMKQRPFLSLLVQAFSNQVQNDFISFFRDRDLIITVSDRANNLDYF